MKRMSLGGVASDWYHVLYSNPPRNHRPTHTNTLRQCIPDESHIGVSLIAPWIVKCNAIVEYTGAMQQQQRNKNAGATVVVASVAG